VIIVRNAIPIKTAMLDRAFALKA